MQVRFVTCDVFTDTAFGGNPLAVIPDARGLSTAQMQSIAREFNYSESTFVLPPEGDALANVRIFTPLCEIPFAGHPTIGTALMLASEGAVFGTPVGSHFELEMAAGRVPVSIETDWASFTAPQPFRTGPEITRQEVAECLGLAPEDVRTDNHPPQWISVGLTIVVAELADRDALARARVHTDAFQKADRVRMAGKEPFALYPYVADEHTLYARMFDPLCNIPEDPATGSAAAALAVLRAKLMKNQSDRDFFVHQGLEMGRKSTIRLQTRVETSSISVTVAGQAVRMADGTMRVGD